MTDKDDENSLLKKVKNSLDHSEKNIDAGNLSALNRIRQEALKIKEREKTGRLSWLPTPLPALATATVVLLAVFLVFTGEREQAPDNNLEDLEILVSNNKLEFYEDLDFYAWLAEEEHDAG